MKANWLTYIPLGLVMLGMVTLSAIAEDEPKKAETDVKEVLPSTTVVEEASRLGNGMELNLSALNSYIFEDTELPSVDFRGFSVVFTIDNAPGKPRKYATRLASVIASKLIEAGATGGNLESYKNPEQPDFPDPRIHYRRGNVQGFAIVQVSVTREKREQVSIVCYEHLLAPSGIPGKEGE